MTALRPAEVLQAALDRALAPDDDDSYDPVFEATDSTCSEPECEAPATEWRLTPPDPTIVQMDGYDVTMFRQVCVEHGDPRWQIQRDDRATWALHKLRAERRQLAEIDQLYAEELARLSAWRDQQRARHQRTADFFETHLIRYGWLLRSLDQPGKERKSHSLPAGTIKFRQSTQVEITDEGALIEWAEGEGEHPEIVKKSVGVQPVKDLLGKKDDVLQPCTPDGVAVPGIEIHRPVNPSVVTT